MNDIMKNLKRQLVDPAMKQIKSSALGYVVEVNEQLQTANVIIMEKDGQRRRKNNLSFDTGRGIQSKYLEVGDTVEIGYRNNSYKHSYIVRVHEKYVSDTSASLGQDLPNYMDLM